MQLVPQMVVMQRDKLMSRCEWKGCKLEPVLTWLGKGLCQKHWERLCTIDGTEKGVREIQLKTGVRRPFTEIKEDDEK